MGPTPEQALQRGKMAQYVDYGKVGADVAQRRDGEPQPGVPLPPEQNAIADQLLAESVADIGAPTLAHYRDVYANLGLDWPGDAKIRAMYPVADGVLSR